MSKASAKKAAKAAPPVEETRTSETDLIDNIIKYSDAGGAIIHIRTREAQRCAKTLRRHLILGEAEPTPYHEWDCINGIRSFTKADLQGAATINPDLKGASVPDTENFFAAFEHPMKQLRSSTSEVRRKETLVHHFVYIDAHPFMDNNPMVATLVQQYAMILPPSNVCIIIITPDAGLPGVPVGLALSTDFATPTYSELRKSFDRTMEQAEENKDQFEEGVEISDEDIHQIVNLGAGMTELEFETYSALSIVAAGQKNVPKLTVNEFVEGISEGKTAVVKQSEILELSHPEDLANVGGMGRLKRWLAQRSECFSEDAQNFGIESPKGMVLVGVPGTGKSLTAKVTASVLGVPLIRMDIARVFSKYVGDSESRIQAALRMVESMAPCVLFVDEIDKALGGAEGGGDSGTSSRVLGTYLTWLQDNKARVFSVVTANRVAGLPPELLRYGRFDKIWSLGLPEATDRREALAIHLRRRGRDIERFTDEELSEFDEASAGYVPAEIESAVKDSIISAFMDKDADDVEMRHIIAAIKDMVPLSISNKGKIDAIVEWARTNATPVNDPPEADKPRSTIVARPNRIRR